MAKCCNPWNRIGAWGLLAACLLLAGAALASGQGVIVTTEEGRRFSGELVDVDEERVVLEIAGVRTPIRRDIIEQIEEQPPADELYRQRLAALDEDDLEGRTALVRELTGMGAYDVASQAVADLQRDFPDEEHLHRLQLIIDARRRLERQPPSEREPGDRPEPPEPAPEPADRLTQEQINRIRVYEVNLEDEPRVQVPRETWNRIFQRYIDDDRVPRGRAAQAELRRAPGHQQLALIFDLQAREVYGDINVRQEPAALRGFRTQIHRRYVLNYCATNQCHGGESAPGGLALLNRHGQTDTTVYTNFYLLHQYENEEGRMINRPSPQRSLLLQYGLARNAAVHPHPEARGWRPIFRNIDDATFQRYANIIGTLYQPTPNYGIDFTLPGRPPDQPDEDAPQPDDSPAEPPEDESPDADE